MRAVEQWYDRLQRRATSFRWRLTRQRRIPYDRHRRSALYAHAYCELLEALIGEGVLVSGLTRSSRLEACF